MKHLKSVICLLMALVLVAGTCPVQAKQADTSFEAEVDESSSYQPTQIVNGDFETTPFMGFVYGGKTYSSASELTSALGGKVITSAVPNGVGGGWNTTETTLLGGSGLFEYAADGGYGGVPAASGSHYIEMNAYNSAVLSQDLYTQGGDVIRWTLQHHSRSGYGGDPQTMCVEVGAPEYSDGSIVAASGVNSNVNSHIQSSTLGQYSSTGISKGSGTVAFASNEELVSLSLAQSVTTWKEAAGIYVVPEGQNVTRFAFIATTTTQQDGGNLLDNITFSTLIGNLSATLNADGSVTVLGYWGEDDGSKNLLVKIGEETYTVDMSAINNSNFKLTIPASDIGDATSVSVYHEDYESAKRTITINRSVKLALSVAEANKAFTGTLDSSITGLTSSDLTVYVDGQKVTSGYTVNVNSDGKSFTLTFDTALNGKENIGVSISKSGYKVTDQEDGAGNTIVTLSLQHIHCDCGDADCSEHGGAKTWTAWTSTTSLPTAAGYYYLENDVTLSGPISPATGVHLCLNGHDVTNTVSGNSIYLNSNVNFTLTDCSSKVRYATDPNGDGVYETVVDTEPDTNVNYFAFTGGAFIGGTSNTGGVIYVNGSGSVFNMYGGTITGHYSTHIASAVGVMNGTFNMYGGTIGGCRAKDREGAIHNWYGTTNFYGGTLCNNVSVHYSENNRTNVYGGTFTGNTGRILTGWSTVNIYGGTFTKNTASTWLTNEVAIMTGGSITNNTLTVSGIGAVYSLLTVGGDAVIADNINTVDNCEYNVRLLSGAKIAVATGDNAPKEGMNVGIYSITEPTEGSPVQVTTGSGDAYVYFNSDKAPYVTSKNKGDYVQLKVEDVPPTVTMGTGEQNFATRSYTYPEAAVTGTVCQVTITVGDGSFTTEGYTPDKTDLTGLSKTYTVSNAAAAQKLLRECVFTPAADKTTQDVTVTVSGDITDLSADTTAKNITVTQKEIDGVMHYYAYVQVHDENKYGESSCTFSKAYEAAKKLYYNGLQGYLVTITSAEEEAVLDSITTWFGYGGAARVTQANASQNADYFTTNGKSDGTMIGASSSYDWYWVCGPEAGTKINTSSSPVSGSYSNWNSGEPNGKNSSTGEYVMMNHFDTNKKWNDVNETLSMPGYFVEWSEDTRIDASLTASDDVTHTVIDGYLINFYPNGEDNTVDGEAFTHKQITVVKGDESSLAGVPDIQRDGYVFLGWTNASGGYIANYTTEDLANLEDVVGYTNIYPVWGIEIGLPVYVALSDESDLPFDSNRTYSFTVNTLTSDAPLPDTTTIELAAPTATGAENRVGYGAEDENNPWRMTFEKGIYQYYITQTSTAQEGETLDLGRWVLEVEVLPDVLISGETELPKYRIQWAEYDHAVDSLSENSFDIAKTTGTAASVSVAGGKTSVVLGGNAVISGDGFNTAVIKGKFEIDFNRDFQVVGSLLPPSAATPDGTCVGFMPSSTKVYSSDLQGGGNLGYIGNSKFAKAIVLDFDPYNNGSSYGDPGYTHFALTQTSSSGWPVYSTAQFANVASKWPTQPCQYTITNDATAKTLTYKITLNDGSEVTFVYKDPVAAFGTNIAYFFMSGVVRYGSAKSWGLGAVGSTAPSLTMNFDSFYYLDEQTAFDEDSCQFVNEIIYVAESGSGASYQKWGKVQNAINTASSSDIRMLRNSTENLTIPSGETISLEMNGKTVTPEDSTEPVITNNGNLTLTNSAATNVNITGGSYAVMQNGTMTIGGNLSMTGNASGNLYLPNGKTVTISSDNVLTSGSVIGVTTQSTPSASKLIDITSGTNAADYHQHFTSDPGYQVVLKGDDDKTVIVGHVHNWIYRDHAADASITEDTITAACVANLHGAIAKVSITIKAEDMIYTGKAYDQASYVGKEAWEQQGLTVPAIFYEGTGTTTYASTVTPPTKSGTYTATIKAGDGYKAVASFEIQKADPTYVLPTDLPGGFTAPTTATLADIELPEGFSWEDPLTTPVGTKGDHELTLTYTPEDTDNYNVLTGIKVTLTVIDYEPLKEAIEEAEELYEYLEDEEKYGDQAEELKEALDEYKKALEEKDQEAVDEAEENLRDAIEKVSEEVFDIDKEEAQDEMGDLIDDISEEDDSEEIQEILEQAKEDLENYEQDPEKTPEENKEAMEQILEDAKEQVEEKREEYLDEYRDEEEEKLLDEDSDEEYLEKLREIEEIIDAYEYDHTKTLDENKEALEQLIQEQKEQLPEGKIEDVTDTEQNAGKANWDVTEEEYKTLFPFTNEELARQDLGVDTKLWLEVTDINETVTEEDETLVNSKMKADENAYYYGIEVFKQLGNSEAVKITELEDEIEISITLPESLQKVAKGKTRKFAIVAVHEGEARRIQATYDEKTGTLTFRTGKFSTYAVVYRDTDIPATGDAGYLGWLYALIISGCGAAIVLALRKRRSAQ